MTGTEGREVCRFEDEAAGEAGSAEQRMPKQTDTHRRLAWGLWAPENQAFVRAK